MEIRKSATCDICNLMKIFDEFGGVYMMQASWDVRSRSWNYEVIVYAK